VTEGDKQFARLSSCTKILPAKAEHVLGKRGKAILEGENKHVEPADDQWQFLLFQQINYGPYCLPCPSLRQEAVVQQKTTVRSRSISAVRGRLLIYHNSISVTPDFCSSASKWARIPP